MITEQSSPPTDTVSRHSSAPWDWKDVLLVVIIYFAGLPYLLAFFSLGLTFLLDNITPTSAHAAIEDSVAQLFIYVGFIVVLYLILHYRHHAPFSLLGWKLPRFSAPFSFVGWKRAYMWWWLLVAIPAAFVAELVALFLEQISYTVIPSIIPHATNPQCSAIQTPYTGFFPLAFAIVCVVAPCAEETIFRGFFYGWLRKRLPTWLAIIISALLFSAAHGIALLFLPLFGVGVILALMYELSDSLIPGIIIHGLFNFIGLLAILYGARC